MTRGGRCAHGHPAVVRAGTTDCATCTWLDQLYDHGPNSTAHGIVTGNETRPSRFNKHQPASVP